MEPSINEFPAFSLHRLLKTVFEPREGQRVCILIDLPDPHQIKDFAFLKTAELPIQSLAHEVFYQGLHNGVLQELKLAGGEIFAYEITGGSNLDLPDLAVDPQGREISLEKELYPNYDIVLCISTYSATAPLTAFARKYRFRGATLHGLNEIILKTGLAVDYNEVSRKAEILRLAMTKADAFEIDFAVDGRTATLRLECEKQEAQKSHGLCRGDEPDVANLPAGEVYYVPRGAEGEFPMRFPDGTVGLMTVTGGRIQHATLIKGEQQVMDAFNDKISSDPVTGELGELGFGTQRLPPAGTDIQDEKILGTLHVATGRSDHLGGDLTPDRFANKKHATHDDILFSPTKTPEILVPQVRMYRDSQMHVVIENYKPGQYLQSKLND